MMHDNQIKKRGYLLIDAIVGLGLMLAGVITATGLLIQFRLAEKRQESDWIASLELRNAAETLKVMPMEELQAMKEVAVSQGCKDLLKEPELTLITVPMDGDPNGGVRLDLRLTWIDSQQRIQKPKSLSVWRFDGP